MKTYTEMCQLSTYKERLEYLMLKGKVGMDTFGMDRAFNQMLYHGREWALIRPRIITRDKGCDLGLEGHEFVDDEPIIIHHINPITLRDIEIGSRALFDPNNLISCRLSTHNAIHYANQVPEVEPVVRTAHDTCPWRI